jgi:AcrR family transcriptional regulator
MPRVFQNYKEEYKEEARKRILDAAIKVVKKKGYLSMTLDDVSREVGVTKGTLYLYFKNKEELYQNVLIEVANSVRESMAYRYVDGNDLDTVLERRIDRMITLQKKFGIENNVAFVSEWISVAARDPATRSKSVEIFQGNLKSLENCFRILQERKLIPENLDMHAVTPGIFALTGMVKFRLFLGDDEEEIKKWWISSVKKLLEV